MVEVVAALIWRGNRFMICQRPAHKARGLLWEFVGGKVEPGETKAEALVRECREELGLCLRVLRRWAVVEHAYPSFSVRLTFFICEIEAGEVQPAEHAAVRWIAPEEAGAYAFCPADAKMLSLTDLAAALEG